MWNVRRGRALADGADRAARKGLPDVGEAILPRAGEGEKERAGAHCARIERKRSDGKRFGGVQLSRRERREKVREKRWE